MFQLISIHALREEGDELALLNSRRPRPVYFYPRPPRGGRPRLRVLDPFVLEISIHALREEGDVFNWATISAPRDILISIHALREEGDRVRFLRSSQRHNFYPRPPRGGRQFGDRGRSCFGARISIHALREEGDFSSRHGCATAASGEISIHALREEGDSLVRVCTMLLVIFLSTPSARRATSDTIGMDKTSDTIISIHALREEGDCRQAFQVAKVLRDFYPRPPRGGRPRQRQQQTEHGKFLSTPSARRATILSSAPRAVDWISIHALREEGDLMWQDT